MWFLLPTPRNAPRAVRGAWAALGQLHGEADPCFWKVPYKISLCGKTSLRGPPSRSRGARSPGPVVRLAPAFPAGSPGAVKTTDPESPRSGSSPRTWVRPPAGPSGPARRRYRARARLPPGAGRPLPPARGRLAGPGTRRAPRPHTRAFRPELAAGFPEPPGGRGATAEENGRSAHRTFQGPGRRPGPELTEPRREETGPTEASGGRRAGQAPALGSGGAPAGGSPRGGPELRPGCSGACGRRPAWSAARPAGSAGAAGRRPPWAACWRAVCGSTTGPAEAETPGPGASLGRSACSSGGRDAWPAPLRGRGGLVVGPSAGGCSDRTGRRRRRPAPAAAGRRGLEWGRGVSCIPTPARSA